MSGKVMIALNTSWNLFNFRAGLIRALVAQGHDVVTVAPPDAYSERLPGLGCRYVPLPMDNRGTHPGRDAWLFCRFLYLMWREKPDVFLGYTVKPNVFGSLAAHCLGVPVINNIAGLGAVFIQESWLTRLVRQLYRLALRPSHRVFFQNEDDRQLFITGGLVRAASTDRLPGSGIDLTQFTPQPLPSIRNPAAPVRCLLIARMLWDKGVGEYVEAARRLRQQFPSAEFGLLGFLDVQNPAAISREQMEAWVSDGVIRYWGETDDVRPFIAEADCVILPSYREGTPRTLLEAAAMGRPIVTTDTVGCRDVVDVGINGLLCRVRDAADLADKMAHMLRLPPDARQAMGQRGREKIEREFDEQIVIRRYQAAIDSATTIT